jgi:hypothetical protein
MKTFLSIACILFFQHWVFAWGFHAHKEINKYAIYTLPPELIGFYKKHAAFIIANAVAPDKRRYLNPDEPCRHFIDLDTYPDSIRFQMPISWYKAIEKYPEDTLKKHGILPWNLYLTKIKLTEAFRKKDIESILKLSADIGHYIGDAHVPLHTCHNYNGQYTNQHGIHGLWESRIPELMSHEYDMWVGMAKYISNPATKFWSIVYESHKCLPEVFLAEIEASKEIKADRKYSYEERNGLNNRVYSKEFSSLYSKKLSNQIQNRFKESVYTIGSIWYTCWVDAGQPNLEAINLSIEISNLLEKENQIINQKNHSDHQECNSNFH